MVSVFIGSPYLSYVARLADGVQGNVLNAEEPGVLLPHAVDPRGSRLSLLHCREDALGDAVARLLHLGLEGGIRARVFSDGLHGRAAGDILRTSFHRRKL